MPNLFRHLTGKAKCFCTNRYLLSFFSTQGSPDRVPCVFLLSNYPWRCLWPALSAHTTQGLSHGPVQRTPLEYPLLSLTRPARFAFAHGAINSPGPGFGLRITTFAPDHLLKPNAVAKRIPGKLFNITVGHNAGFGSVDSCIDNARKKSEYPVGR
jgi:hypothetical protein